MDETLPGRIHEAAAGRGPRAERARAAVDAIRAGTGARWVGIYTVADGTVSNDAWSGPAAPAHPTFAADEGLTAHAIATGAVAVSNDVGHDPRYLRNQDDSGSELIVPVRVGGQVVGTLDIEDDRAGAFAGASITRYEALAVALRPLWSDELPDPEHVAQVTVERDHVFATVDASVLALDLYRAPDADAPLVLYVHGGGWRSGDKADQRAERLAPMAALGVTVASANYRLVPGARFPDQLHDLKGAVRWLRAHGARLGLRTERVGVWGASAGAYLGSLLGLSPDELEGTVGGNLEQSSAVQAVVHWFGQADLLAAGSRTDAEARLVPFAFEAGLLGVRSLAGVADRAAALSLLARVTRQAPPFLIAHGDRDHVVSRSEGEALHDALSRSGADSRFVLLGGAGHEGPEFDAPANLAMTAAWLRATLAV